MFLLLATIALCKVSKGAFGAVIGVVGVWGALTRKPAYALICFAFLPFLTIMNPVTFGFGGALGMSARLFMPAMTVAMMVAAAARKGRQALPLLSLLAYAVAAFVSSIEGYAPMISYMKIVNFFLFIIGIYMGTRNIDKDPRGLVQLRAFFFAFSVFIVAGSALLGVVSPVAAHASSVSWAEGDMAADIIMNRLATTGDAGFLCGVVNHSQCLGPTTVCVAGWVLMDMLFVEKRFMLGHVLTLALCPYVLYQTKSRTSLLAFIVIVGIIVVYCVPKFRVSPTLKHRLQSMVMAFLILLGLGAVGLEMHSGGMRKWVTKYGGEEAVDMETLTATRQGLIEQGLHDFHQNPLLGMGFQVSYEHQFLNAKGKLILSAPIEKGFIPTMILGETGIVGAVVFSAFLIIFFGVCARQQYYATIALFTAYLATNLGEATFFSPGGTGGPEWIISLVGGFVIDMVALVQRRNAACLPRGFFGAMPPSPGYGMRPWRG